MGVRRFLLLTLLALPALADESEWKTVLSGPVTIKNRAIAGSDLREVWAEADLKAPVRDVQESLLDIPAYRSFMPFAKESRNLSEKQADGAFFSYIMLDLPIVGKRDYILRTVLQDSVAADSRGVFKYRWTAHPEYMPEREGISRIKMNTGSWEVTPSADGKGCHAVYRFAIDPGGWLPAFAVNFGNERGVVDTFTAVEKEAQRRRDARQAAVKQ